MDKILVRLEVPAAHEAFDLFVPVGLDIRTLTRSMADGAGELCSGRYTPSHEEMLNQKNPDRLLDPERTLSEYGILDGAVLVLI